MGILNKVITFFKWVKRKLTGKKPVQHTEPTQRTEPIHEELVVDVAGADIANHFGEIIDKVFTSVFDTDIHRTTEFHNAQNSWWLNQDEQHRNHCDFSPPPPYRNNGILIQL